jgi:restriction system protein
VVESAGSVLALGIAAGVLLAGVGVWWLWRYRAQSDPPARASNMTARISDAAAGLPREQELRHWPRERLRSVAVGLAESEGYEVVTLAGGAEADLALRRLGETTPRVIVWCAAPHGAVHAKPIRELFGTMTAEGAPVGWFVATVGFSADAKTFAEQHDIVLIDSERLATMLRDLPPLILPKVLARVG